MLKEIKTKFLHYFVDEHNLRQGEFKSYHENGQKFIHTFCQNDKCHGEYERFYDNGQLNIHTFYINGKYHGEFKRYYGNGKLSHATFYYQGTDLKVDPDTLTEQDRVYIMMSGRIPPPRKPLC